MYTEILNIMLYDAPKRDTVKNFCKKYPWAIDLNFLKENHLEIISPKSCPKIENLMAKGDCQSLNRELLPNTFYPTNYWEKLAHLTYLNINAMNIFINVMTSHGFKFTPGVRDKLLLHSLLQNHTKTIIINKINRDIADMYNSLFDDKIETVFDLNKF